MRKQTGAALRMWRRSRHLTQKQLGDLVGRTAQSVSRYENGEDDPSPETVRALDEALDAGGEIVGMFGLTPLPAMDEIRQAFELLTSRVDLLAELVARLEQRVDQLGH